MSLANSEENKNKILDRVKFALQSKIAKPFPEVDENFKEVFVQSQEDLVIHFAESFKNISGKFVFCENEVELIEKLIQLADANSWKNIYCQDTFINEIFQKNNIQFFKRETYKENLDAGVTGCECLVARTGSTLMSSGLESGRALPVYAPVHIVVAYSHQVKWDIDDALNFLKQKYNNNLPSMINLETGPSRTADIQKTLVVGVHGPKEIYVFMING